MIETNPAGTSDQMKFIDDEQFNVLHILSLFPSSRQYVPSLSRGYNDLTLGQEFQVSGCFTGQHYYPLVELSKPVQPILVHLQVVVNQKWYNCGQGGEVKLIIVISYH